MYKISDVYYYYFDEYQNNGIYSGALLKTTFIFPIDSTRNRTQELPIQRLRYKPLHYRSYWKIVEYFASKFQNTKVKFDNSGNVSKILQSNGYMTI